MSIPETMQSGDQTDLIDLLLRRAKRLFLPPANFKHLNLEFDRLLVSVNIAPRHMIASRRTTEGISPARPMLDRLTIDDDSQDADEDADKPKGRILVLTGETGAGKTRAIKRIFRQRSELLETVTVSIVAPSPCTLMQLGRRILPKVGYPIARDKKEHLIWEEVTKRIDEQQVRVLQIDEMQHVLQGANIYQVKKILNTIKSLILERAKPMLLVLSGTCELVKFLRIDEQVRRRCTFVEFERLTIPGDVDMIADSLESLAEAALLQISSSAVDELTPRLIHATNYALGVSMEFSCDAIEEALIEGTGELTQKHFAKVYRSRSGCIDRKNPFLVANWLELDPNQVLDRSGFIEGFRTPNPSKIRSPARPKASFKGKSK